MSRARKGLKPPVKKIKRRKANPRNHTGLIEKAEVLPGVPEALDLYPSIHEVQGLYPDFPEAQDLYPDAPEALTAIFGPLEGEIVAIGMSNNLHT